MEFFKALVISLLAVFAPIHAVIFTVGALIFGDLALGVWAAKKRKEEISSEAMRRTVTKIFVYQIAIMTGYLLETYLMDGLIPIAKLVASVIGAVEFKSLLENATAITGIDFREIVKKLGSKNDE